MLTAFFASQNGTSKTVPKTLTYQFENSSGMRLSIVQGNPENPLTSRTVNVPLVMILM